jgi:VWFA-related protein
MTGRTGPRTRTSSRAAAGVLLAALLLLCQASSTAEPLVETQRVVMVEVPVQVTVKGEPLRGLTVDNFELLDRGKPQEISSFNVLDLTVTAPDEGEDPLLPQVSIAARRHFLLLFDMNVQSSSSLERARTAVEEWLVDALHPWDLVAISAYLPRSGMKLLLNFTSDRDQVRKAIEALGRSRHQDIAFADPLGLELGVARQPFVEVTQSDTANITPTGDSTGVGGDADQAQASMEAIYRSVYEPLQRQGQRARFSALTDSFEELARLMRGVRGRKYVVFLSEGIDSSLIFAADDKEDIERLNQAAERAELWRIDSTQRFGSAAAQKELTDMVEEFRRADCVIQAIETGTERDPGGNQSLSSRYSEGLFFMAHETGGELYRSFNNLGEAMGRMLKKTSVTYLLTFQPEDLKADGKYHKLKVRLKDVPKGARMTHRPGYFAPSDTDRKTAQEEWMDMAASIMEGRDGGEIAASVLATPFRAAGGGAYVPVLVEIDGVSLPLGREISVLSLEIYAYAIADNGRIGGFISQRLSVNLGQLRDAVRRSGLKFFGDLELPSGDYSLRVLIREGRTGLTATRSVPIRIPDASSGKGALLPPLFPEPKGKWLLARESTNGDERTEDRPFPYMFKGEPYLPAARPAVSANGEARMCLVGYNLGEGPFSVRARVIDLLGQVHEQPEILLLEEVEADVPEQRMLLAGFRPEGLPVGEYTLSVTIADDATGRSRSSSIPITVVRDDPVTETVR